mgnify:FL=1
MKKGFTLIELLAVIVILAVISLIATPMILGVIETSKESSAKVSAYGYIDAVETQVAINELDANKTNIEDGVYEVEDLKNTYGLVVKGELPTSNSWVKIEKGQVVDYSLKIGEYVVNYSESGVTITKGGEIRTKPGGLTKSGATKVEASETDTHRGIVYLDPTNLSNVCNAENSVSTTETKTGCMKWYIFNDDGNNYTMILDHNTTARIRWNDDNKNVSYEESNLYSAVQDLKTTSSWIVEPRLITAEEINTITGKNDFDSTSSNSWYYLDTVTQTKEIFTETKRSKYDWLYNNLTLCKTDNIDYGCSIEDKNIYTGYGTAGEGNTYAYWIATIVGDTNGTNVWRVTRAGSLGDYSSNNPNHGIRPVITISKSIIG